MKRNFDAVMLDLHGKPYDKANENLKTLGDICLIAFQNQARGDDALTGPQKLAQYKLASKIVKGGIIELDAPELTLLQERMALTMPAVIYGRAMELLEADPAETPPPPEIPVI